MSATVVISFLIEAGTACGPVAPARLGGGAEVVRAILDVEEQGFQPSAPTPVGASEAPPGVMDGAGTEANSQEADPAAAQCKATPISIASGRTADGAAYIKLSRQSWG